MNDMSGRWLKGYHLQQMIGMGGFGAVYRAHQPVVNRVVAIKAILPDYTNNSDFIRRFEKEAQVVAHLEHPFIVPLFDYWREPEGAYLVMRFLTGGSLALSMVKGGPWSLRRAAKLIEQIGSALSTAHQKGIVHQDLKPANILLDELGNAYLSDFGIAKDIFEKSDLPSVRRIYGSPDYMSPEQATFREVTPQSDIYSLGLILYALLTGEAAFQSNSPTTLIQMQLYEQIPMITLERPDLPAEINQIIKRATDKNPAYRYTDALQMAADMLRIVGGNLQVEAPPPIQRGATQNMQPVQEDRTMAFTENLATPIPTNTMPLGGMATMDVFTVTAPDAKNPYKGLRAFEEADGADFFGRNQLIEQLVTHLGSEGIRARFLAVIGPSGSGKSSVVKAGLLPALRQGQVLNSERWFITTMVPGNNPLEELEQALLRVALRSPAQPFAEQLRTRENALHKIVQQIVPDDNTELLIVIDQFEEVFTRVEDETERTLFLENLVSAVTEETSQLRLIITLRADFYDRPLLYARFGEVVRQCTQVVLPMSLVELEQAISAPARNVGLGIQQELITQILTDVSAQPGILPLLQFTLTELYGERRDNSLTREAYQRMGSISSSLARRADQIYEPLDEAQQQLTQQLFLRLVTPGEGVDDTRRRVLRAELLSLHPDQAVVEKVLDLFGQHRLLTFDRDPATRTPTVEIAHEALILRWQRLRDWLAASRDDVRLQRRLNEATQEWERNNREASYLASGVRLSQFETLLDKPAIVLNADESAYIAASVALRQQRANRVKLFIGSLVVITILAVGLALFAFDRQQQAVQAEATTAAERDRANEQALISRSRTFAISALTQRERLDRSLLTSLEALSVYNTLEARRSLLSNVTANPALVSFLHGSTSVLRSVAVHDDLIASAGDDHQIYLWDRATRQLRGTPLTGHQAPIWDIALNQTGDTLASVDANGVILIWDLDREVEPLRLTGHEGEIWSVAFAPDGTWLATGGADGQVLHWDLAAEQPTGEQVGQHEGNVFSVAYSPDGRFLASGGDDNLITLWDVENEESTTLTGHTNWILTLDFSPDGQFLASSGPEGEVYLWDTAAQTGLGKFATGHTDWIRKVAFAPDGRSLITGSADNTLRVWDLTTIQQVIPPLVGHSNAIWDAAFTPDGQQVVSVGADATAILWQLQPQPILATPLPAAPSPVWQVALSADRCWLAAATGEAAGSDEENPVYLLNLGCDGEVNAEPALLQGHAAIVSTVDFSPDGTVLVSGSVDRTLQLWEVATGTPLSDPLMGHENSITSVVFSPDGQWIASADTNGDILLWEQADGQAWQLASLTLAGHETSITSLVFSPDNRRLASASEDGTVIVWDVATGEAMRQLLASHTDRVETVAFSPDGQLLATGSRDNTIILWDTATLQSVAPPLRYHTNWVTSVAFSVDSTTLASASRDGSVILWDVATRQPLEPALSVNSASWVNSLEFSADGQQLVTGGLDNQLTLWEVSEAAWEALACERANRNLTLQEWEIDFGVEPYRALCPSLP